MTTDTNTYQNGRISRLLLSIALLFGIFSFTGYSSDSRPKLAQVFKTELVVKNRSNFKRCVSYKSILEFYGRNDFSRSYLSSILLELSSLHTNLVTIKQEFASRQCNLQDHVHYYQLVIIEPAPDEYLLS